MTIALMLWYISAPSRNTLSCHGRWQWEARTVCNLSQQSKSTANIPKEKMDTSCYLVVACYLLTLEIEGNQRWSDKMKKNTANIARFNPCSFLQWFWFLSCWNIPRDVMITIPADIKVKISMTKRKKRLFFRAKSQAERWRLVLAYSEYPKTGIVVTRTVKHGRTLALVQN